MRASPMTGSAFASVDNLGGSTFCRRSPAEIVFEPSNGLIQITGLLEHRLQQIALGPEPFEDRLDRKALRAQALFYLGPRQRSGDGRARPWPQRIGCRCSLTDRIAHIIEIDLASTLTDTLLGSG